ncbi:hypothetical protein [Streptomyces sp. NRRL WC-3742]|uniref:hypothetical protein n=1 Tax=Streptomyces sp. NRRL WC-3742 TaxID=1463934 RepID=UPI0004CC5B29|nr:hypothetical protein [Streptomyces sp. NRRL WC-3742]
MTPEDEDEQQAPAQATRAEKAGRYAIGGVSALLAFAVIATLVLSVLAVAAVYLVIGASHS